MKIFVTGATGFVGSAIVQELIRAGHEVLGLARSEAAAQSLSGIGAQIHRGDMEDLDSLRSGVSAADAVIHTAFNHDFSKFKENCEKDKRAIDAMSSVLAGSDRPLIITSALAVLPKGRLVTEDTLPVFRPHANPRIASEEAAEVAKEKGVNVSIVRLPPSVHGNGDRAFIPTLIDLARNKGVSAFIEEGNNCWPAVHRLDAAQLFRLVLESETTGVYHAVAEEGVAFKEIAAVIGERLNVPVKSIAREEANNHFTWFTHFAEMDLNSSSEKTKEKLGWKPKQHGLLNDIDSLNYFKLKG